MMNVRLSHFFCSAERAAWNSAGEMVKTWYFLRFGTNLMFIILPLSFYQIAQRKHAHFTL